MKKFLPYILILVVVVGILSPMLGVKNARADDSLGICAPRDPDIRLQFNLTHKDCTDQHPGWSWTLINKTKNSATTTTPPSDNSCSVTTFFTWNCIASILARFAFLIMGLMALLLWLAGTLLDSIINFTIINMSANLATMTGINIAWKVIRDVMNIGFIFLLVYQGISVILGRKSTDDIRKFIVAIVMAALLVNFSLFFTKILIDASNVVTIGLYRSIIVTPATTPGTTGFLTSDKSGLSVPFMKALGVSDFYSGSFDTMSVKAGGGSNMLIIGLLGSVLFLVVAFAFFATSMMFIIRYIVLLVLLMLSPIAYLGSALPFMSTYSKQWWDSLKGQLLFAPVYMLLTWLVLTLISSPGFITTSGSWGGLLQPDKSGGMAAAAGATNVAGVANSSISLIFNFAVIIGLAIATLVISKSFATQGSKLIGQATGKLTAFAGGAVMGAGAMAGRNTIGRAGNWAANNEKLKDAASKKGLGGFVARATLKASDRSAKSTFDARATSTVGKITGSMGLDIGKVNTKNTFRANLEARSKAEEEFAKKLKPSDVAIARAKSAHEKKIEEMESDEYRAKEEARKMEHLNSDKYKDSETNTNAERAMAENKINETEKATKEKKLEDKNKELEELIKYTKSATYLMDGAKRKEIDDKIKEKRDEIEQNKTEIEDIKKSTEENNKLIAARVKYVSEWKSDTQTEAETEKAKLEKEKVRMEGVYAERTKAYASVVENNVFWNAVTNGVGYVPSQEREAVGVKIRKLATQKDSRTLALEALKKQKEEAKERGEETEDEKKDESEKEPEEKSKGDKPEKEPESPK